MFADLLLTNLKVGARGLVSVTKIMRLLRNYSEFQGLTMKLILRRELIEL